MRADDLLQWVRNAPFVPFRIGLNSGREFEIRHPEMVRVGRPSAYVLSYFGEPADLVEKMGMLFLVLIESIEPLEPARSGQS